MAIVLRFPSKGFTEAKYAGCAKGSGQPEQMLQRAGFTMYVSAKKTICALAIFGIRLNRSNGLAKL